MKRTTDIRRAKTYSWKDCASTEQLLLLQLLVDGTLLDVCAARWLFYNNDNNTHGGTTRPGDATRSPQHANQHSNNIICNLCTYLEHGVVVVAVITMSLVSSDGDELCERYGEWASARRKRAKSAAGERVGVAFRLCAGGAATTRTQSRVRAQLPYEAPAVCSPNIVVRPSAAAAARRF
jgi:hypothetical protein